MARIPVIFLAFANDKVDNLAYLRNLPKELDGIRKSLYKAQQAGLCEVVERASATIEHILDVFQDEYYKDRIAVFHYGGHANGYQLLLESLDGDVSIANSSGLVPFLARQQGLKLIFLNGCSSQQQALDLIQAGVPAVVGTSQAINDDIATKLSIRFYNALANGAPLEQAFAEAIDYVKIEKGTDNMRALYRKGKAEEVADRFPWDIFIREGAEIVKSWNLPETVNNPLFGLPPIPQTYNLPQEPFLFLKRYERLHAEVFFGRSYYIRDLYLKVTDTNLSPIILLYGQSGVGKSSLFDAGLNPRLEESHTVSYVRRIQEIGLTGTLRYALQQGTRQELKVEEVTAKRQQMLNHIQLQVKNLLEKSDDFSETEIQDILHKLQEYGTNDDVRPLNETRRLELEDGLLESWLSIEENTGKPLVIILDQVEEMFTRPNEKLSAELDDFLSVLRGIFSNPVHRPKGKLILGYRKEYHPEIEEQFKKWEIPRTRVFLEHLTRNDIIEVITGLSRQPRLKKQYNLAIEEGLAEIIAEDMLEDRDSPIAPVLQILLTKLWQLAEKDSSELRYFSIKKYQQLKHEGILMDDFFHQQMQKLREWNAEVVDSGLALDLQMFHTTKLGTAGTRTFEEIKTHYAHRRDICAPLVNKLKELYLLIDAYGESHGTALAHDTLAPLVRNVYKESDKPGQRAARVLESKVMNFDGNEGYIFLDEADLAVVEKGISGMRTLSAEELAIIAASEKVRNRRVFVRRATRIAAIAGILCIAALAVWALNEQDEAKRDRTIALKQQARAEKASKEAREATKVAVFERQNAQKSEQNLKKSYGTIQLQQVNLEKALKQAEVEKRNAEEKGIEAAKNAEEARKNEKKARENEDKARENAQAALLASNKAIEEQKTAQEQRNKATNLQLVSKAKAIALKAASLDDNKENNEIKAFLALKAYQLNRDNHGVATDPDVYLALHQALKKYSPDKTTINTGKTEVRCLAYAGDRLIGCKAGGEIVVLQPGSEPGEIVRTGVIPRALAMIPGSSLMALGATNGQVYVYDLSKPTAPPRLLQKHTQQLWAMTYHAKHDLLASVGADRMLRLKPLKAHGEEKSYLHKAGIRAVSIQQKGDMVVFGDEQGAVYTLDLKNTAVPPRLLYQGESVVHALAFSPNDQQLVVGFANGTMKILGGANYDKVVLRIWDHYSVISQIAFNAAGDRMVTSGYDGALSIWDMKDLKNPPIIIDDHKGWVRCITFSPDGSQVVSAGTDRTVRSFVTQSTVLAQQLIRHVQPSIDNERWDLLIGSEINFSGKITDLEILKP